MKRILDTVHGYIMVEDHFIRHIVDTQYFQRLRRVEQSPIRSVYPSARHDRFIHSLGVYHIGTLIVEHLKKEEGANHYWDETKASMGIIYDSYLAACLLHDIGHAPFSHSFEHFFGQKGKLAERLEELIKDKEFKADLDSIMEKEGPNYHEFMSAIVICAKYKDGLARLNINYEFVVRMITGVFYQVKASTHQIHNCFISLLHSNIIDADRLDYACRDVWASGYSTSSIDLRRLISALHIKKNNESDYVVCFESNSLNEIEGVLNVKDFQSKYVINHHTVNYDQWLLEHAVRKMALEYYPNIPKDENGTLALNKIINEQSIIGTVTLPKDNITISNLSDDDLVFLMKQHPNIYYDEWSSRQYTHFPLWKSRDEFLLYFKGVDLSIQVSNTKFENTIRKLLINKGEKDSDIIITQVVFKPRINMNSLYIVIADQLIRYTDIYPAAKNINVNQYFYYVFIAKKPEETIEERLNRKNMLNNAIRSAINMLYMDYTAIS